MKKVSIILLLATILFSSFLISGNELSKEDRKKAVEHFKETKAFLKKEIKGLSEEQLNWKPADSVWSVANCVEHIAITESGIFEWAMETLKAPADDKLDMSKKATDEDIIAKVADRSQRFKAPEIFHPSGRFNNTAGSYKAFENKRDSIIQYIKTTKDDLRGHFTQMPLGTGDTYQVLLLLSAHTKRHTLQIVELKAMPGFPKN